MRTTRALTVSPSMLCAGGPALGGACSGGYMVPGVPGLGGMPALVAGVVSQHALRQTPPLWTEWQTGVEIIPWPQLHLQAVIKVMFIGKLASIFLQYPSTQRIPELPQRTLNHLLWNNPCLENLNFKKARKHCKTMHRKIRMLPTLIDINVCHVRTKGRTAVWFYVWCISQRFLTFLNFFLS